MRFLKASLLVKLGILALIVFATIQLVHLQSELRSVNAENAALTQQLNTTKQENEKLTAADEDLQSYRKQYDGQVQAAGEDADTASIAGSIDSAAMEELAREQGYVNPDEIVIVDVNN